MGVKELAFSVKGYIFGSADYSTLFIDQKSLTNTRIRQALKNGDRNEVFETILLLLNGNTLKAKGLARWFRSAAKSLHADSKGSQELLFMRMWQLGNLDITDVSEAGEPRFSLTYTGAEKVKDLPEELWYEALLQSDSLAA